MKLVKMWVVDLVVLSGLALLCYLLIFQHLGDFSVRMWDEARNGVNALEMLRTKNPVVTYYNGVPDLWNTKPPLLVWLIALGFKTFGISELTLRLPSAIAASMVVLIIYLFAAEYLKDRWIGILSCLILFSAFGFFDTHIARTGDYDALLTLLVFTGSLTAFTFFNTWKREYLYVSLLFWILAVYTKGVAGLLVWPGIGIYIAMTGKVKKLLKLRDFWFALIIMGVMVGGYYLGRNALNPGYLQAVWQEEWFGRITRSNEAATNRFLYYWKWLADFRFQHFIYVVPFTILGYFLVKQKTLKAWTLFAYLITVSYYLVISFSQTKNIWYDAQLYPFMALLVAIFCLSLIRKLPKIAWVVPILILSFYLQRYVRTNLAFIQRPDIEKDNPCLKYGYFFRDNSYSLDNVVGTHLDADHCIPFVYYMEKAGIPMKTVPQIAQDDLVLTCDEATIEALDNKFAMAKVYNHPTGCTINNIQ